MRSLFLYLLLFVFPAVAVSQQRFEITVLRNIRDGKIKQYETVEIGIRIPTQERMFRAFLEDHSKGVNPYQQNFLRMQFICHGKTYTANAFYMQDAVADDAQNKYIVSDAEWPWRVRFAVPDTGEWQSLVLIGEDVKMSTPQASGISFTCIPGPHHGYLQLAPDQKHFQYTDGTPFFVLGQNITCADDPVLRGHPAIPPVYITGYYDVYHYLNNLADNGGNYVRIGMAPWSTGIAYKADNVYLQDRACALDSMMRIAEARGLHVQLAIDLTNVIWKENFPGYWTVAGPSPYKKPGMTDADMLNDSAALASFYQYVRYVYARWAFSPTVGAIEILGEQDKWQGYEGREQYFTNFIQYVDSMIKNEFGDRNRLITTSITNHTHYDRFASRSISYIDRHHYDNDFRCNQKRFDIIHSRAITRHRKPFLFGEMGMINGPVNDSDADDFEYCNDVSYHNAIWSTFFMGGAGTGLYWWQWKNDTYRANTFPALRFFLDSVIAKTKFVRYEEWDRNGLETFYEVDSAKSVAVGWVHNTSYWWGNMMQDCRDRNGKEKILPKDNDKTDKPENRTGTIFIVKGLQSGKTYHVTFYSTREKGVVLQTAFYKTNALGKIKIPFPAQADCVFKIEL